MRLCKGTILLKATFENADDRLTPGQFVNVTVDLSVITEAVVVPPAAVQVGQTGQYVFVVKADNTVELRTVRCQFLTELASSPLCKSKTSESLAFQSPNLLK